ncbi:MAG: SpoIIE family protein phosphatase [Methylococcaceae bacterium]|nr:SpoIIE family protein phosphatase [Methylococcaceae bacterium]
MNQLIDELTFPILIIEWDKTDVCTDKPPRISQANHVFSLLSGYSETELLAQPMDLMLSVDDLNVFCLSVSSKIETKSFEARLIPKTGSQINVLLSLSHSLSDLASLNRRMLLVQPINGKKLVHQETVIGYNTIENRILQCHEIETALAESEERFRQMAEMTGEWLWEQDCKGYYIYSSIAVKQILGLSQEEVIGKHYTDLLTLQDKVNQQYYATSEEAFFAITNHYRHKDGHLVLTESTGLPILSPEGELLKWRGADRDITAKMHFQEALIDSEKRIRLIIESSINAIVIMDSYGIITDWNRRAEDMFGWSTTEAVGQPLAELIIPARNRYAHSQGLKHFLLTGNGPLLNKQIEQVALRRDGTEFPVEISVSPLKLDNMYIFSGFIHDISARKAAEQQIRQAQINLAIAQNELKIAQQIQASLLPAEPIKNSHFEVTGFCLPADRVGGDYFDYFFRSDELLDIVIADVSGHSIGPSLFMVETRSVIRAQANQSSTPSETLTLLNKFLFHDLNNADFFISLFYLQYDNVKQQLRFANAGHPPPLLFNPERNSCLLLDADGLILGVHETVQFEEKIIGLTEKDMILLYTDGLTETENVHGEFFGLERVKEIFIAHSSQSPQQIIAELLKQLKSFRHNDKLNDDITLMVFKRSG